jgi:hypothetical protein
MMVRYTLFRRRRKLYRLGGRCGRARAFATSVRSALARLEADLNRASWSNAPDATMP